jgi:uncharacterized protein with FMN-binding domain
MMKRIVTWLLGTISILVLLFGYNTSTSGTQSASPPTSIISGTSGSNAGSAAAGHGNSSTGKRASGTNSSSTSKAVTVTGDVAATQWGPVQVELTVNGGTITKVSVLQYPSGNSTDAQINSYALPILIQETLDSQGSKVDMVSGATVTSGGYTQSLQNALDQAAL